MGKKYRVLLTNHIVLYARLTYVEPYLNILEPFCTKMHFLRLVKRTNQVTVYAYFMVKVFITTVVSNFTEILKPRNFNIILI